MGVYFCLPACSCCQPHPSPPVSLSVWGEQCVLGKHPLLERPLAPPFTKFPRLALGSPRSCLRIPSPRFLVLRSVVLF